MRHTDNNRHKFEVRLAQLRVLAVVCTQFGDSAKGKFVDLLASMWAEVVARGTGGANAGHTVRVGENEIVLHLVPCGILHNQVMNLIGSGVAVEPATLLDEISMLSDAGLPLDNLQVSLNAKLVLPQHVVLDRVREGAKKEGKIGTTGRGMGPIYADHASRMGLVMNDLLNPDVFVRKLRRNLEEKVRLLRTYDPDLVRAVLHQEILGNGKFYSAADIFDVDAIVTAFLDYGRQLSNFIADTDEQMQNARDGGSRILLEGAQGNLLSVDHGTYPYVTSSDSTVAGLAKGVGLKERDLDVVFGIAKSFFMTRVGEGPFPTELGGERSAVHCAGSSRAEEERSYPNASLDDPDEFVRGIAIRRVGAEYGATTKRPRRTGWLDLPLLRYSRELNGSHEVILTKLDVLDAAASFKICTHYVYRGPDYNYGAGKIEAGDEIGIAIPDVNVMKYCEPVYREMPGWQTSTREIRRYGDLPRRFREAVRFVEREAGVHVNIVSVGPERDETIFVDSPWR